MATSESLIRFWIALAGRIKQFNPLILLAGTIGAVTMLFVGCERLFDATRWAARTPSPEPPAVMVDRLIRVRVGNGTPSAAVELQITAPFTVVDGLAGSLIGAEHPPLPRAAARASPGGISVGGEQYATSNLLITPARDAAIVLNQRTYRGLLRILREGEALVFINIVDVEAYLRGVLRGELPRYFHPESFKAQCVAARSYALYQKGNAPAGRAWDVVDHEGSQMYIGVGGEDAVAVSAVEETGGEVCVWSEAGNDHPFCTYYSSACGGLSQHVNNVKLRDPDPPPLRGGVPCDDCYLAPFYRWGPVKMAKTELTRKLAARYPTLKRLGTITELRPKALTADGRIIRIELTGATGKKETLVGEDFRLVLGGRVIKSTNCKIEDPGDHFVFSDGKGFGHGMGLCQHGMETKARKGTAYKQILAAYFPGASVKKRY